MRLLCDQNIHLLDYYFTDVADIQIMSAETIGPQDLADIDILLVRSKTQVNQNLLKSSQLKFLGSCVSGIDHLDVEYLNRAGIPWYAATGCNAKAVMQYVERLIQALSHFKKKKAAVVGVGHVGKLVVYMLEAKGFDVLQCDPLRACVEPTFSHVDLDDLQDIDLLCLHTPFTFLPSQYPTNHMINEEFLTNLKPHCTIINAGRGEVVDAGVIQQFSDKFTWVLDVWPSEPEIGVELVKIASIATPHIAGHTLEGKWLGTKMLYDAMAAKFAWPQKAMPDLPNDEPHDNLIAFAQQFKQNVLNNINDVQTIFQTARQHYV